MKKKFNLTKELEARLEEIKKSEVKATKSRWNSSKRNQDLALLIYNYVIESKTLKSYIMKSIQGGFFSYSVEDFNSEYWIALDNSIRRSLNNHSNIEALDILRISIVELKNIMISKYHRKKSFTEDALQKSVSSNVDIVELFCGTSSESVENQVENKLLIDKVAEFATEVELQAVETRVSLDRKLEELTSHERKIQSKRESNTLHRLRERLTKNCPEIMEAIDKAS